LNKKDGRKDVTHRIMQVTDKFMKELSKFYIWAADNQHLVLKNQDSTDTIINCDEKSLPIFKEPGRNKMDTYIKTLLSNYTVLLDGEKCTDYKVISNDFKNNKPKRKRKPKTNLVTIQHEEHADKNDKHGKHDKNDNQPQERIIRDDSTEPTLEEHEFQQLDRTGTKESDTVSDIMREIDEIILSDVE
jgi:hypothetical protein